MSADQFVTVVGWVLTIITVILLILGSLETIFLRYLKKYAWAIKIYNIKIFLSSKNDDFYVQRGWAYSELKDYERAIQDYSRAIELASENARAYLNRGFAHLQLKLYEKAIEDCNRAIALDAKEIWIAYNNRGAAFLSLKEYELAIKDLDEAIKENPTCSSAYRNRGNTYYRLKEYQPAIQNYDQAIALDSNDVDIHFNRGFAHLQLRHYSEALQDYNRAIELSPLYACSYNNRGVAYSHLRNLQQARLDFTRAWELQPKHLYHGLNAEWIAMSEERPDSAMAERLEQMAATDPEEDRAYVCRGIAFWLRENYEQALIELEQALAIATRRESLFWKGVICASLQHDKEAMDAIQQAIDLNIAPISLLPLRLFEQKRPDFYETYVVPLLEQYLP